MGLFIHGLSAIGCALARDFTQLLISRLIQGVGLGLFGPAILGLAAEFEQKERVFALYRSSQTAAIIFAPIAGGYVGRLDLGYPFLVNAMAMELAAVTLNKCLEG